MVMNEKVSKTNTVCLNVMKKSRVSEHKERQKNGSFRCFKGIKNCFSTGTEGASIYQP